MLVIGCLGILASSVRAQNVDMDLMAKWSAVTVVHYAVTGEYTGEPTVILGTKGMRRTAKVTDRVEITFDWDQNETALVGTPTFKNFPSAVSVTAVPGCPPARINGTYEHFDVVSVKQFSTVLQLAVQQRSPAGAVPYGESQCGEAWDDAAAKSETSDVMLIVPPTVYFAMPSAGGGTMSISKDGKSIVLVEPRNGWTWTYTPTPVR
jgi:hypothetical protein